MKVPLEKIWARLLIPIYNEPVPLKEIRKWLEWSQSYLAKEAGVSTATISRIENGNNSGTIATNYETASRLANALGCSVDEIVWPGGLSGNGRHPGHGPSTSSPLWQEAYCLKCFTAHSLSSNHGDKMCETYG